MKFRQLVHSVGARTVAFAVLGSMLLYAAKCGAAPIQQDDSATRAAESRAAITAVAEPASPSEAHRPSARAGADNPPHARLGAALGSGAAATVSVDSAVRATVPERHGAAAPVEENPSVDVLDVTRSVLESAIGSTSWFRVGSHRPLDRARRGDGGGMGELPPDLTGRNDDNADAERLRVGGPGGGTSDAPQLTAGPRSNPIRDAVQLVRELIGHPMAWVIGVLALLASLVLAVVRGYGK